MAMPARGALLYGRAKRAEHDSRGGVAGPSGRRHPGSGGSPMTLWAGNRALAVGSIRRSRSR